MALVRFEGDKTMTVSVSWAMNGPDEDLNFKLYGTKAGASLSPFAIYGEEAGYLADIRPVFQREDAWKEGFFAEVAHFVECVGLRRQTESSAADGYTVQQIISAIYQSSDSKREVVLQ